MSGEDHGKVPADSRKLRRRIRRGLPWMLEAFCFSVAIDTLNAGGMHGDCFQADSYVNQSDFSTAIYTLKTGCMHRDCFQAN